MTRDDPHGWLDFWDQYRSGAWEPDTLQFLRDCLKPGDLFVDVGAWIGPVSIWAHMLGAYTLAFEPDPIAYEELERRVPGAWYGAIATRSGARVLLPNPKPGGEFGDSMSRLANGRHGEAVGGLHGAARASGGVYTQAWTLQGILQYRPAPALVKIDVEGYETILMRSLGPWLAERGIPLQVSCHGTLVSAQHLAGYTHIEWPDNPMGDIRAWN
jgi:FkbM family methyltransferase